MIIVNLACYLRVTNNFFNSNESFYQENSMNL